MKCFFEKELYPKEVIVKAAYFFTEKYYITVNANRRAYVVAMSAKSGQEDPHSEIDLKEFQNEVLIQLARYQVAMRTKNLRELIVGRALASTMIDHADQGFVDDGAFDADDILNSWFDVNG